MKLKHIIISLIILMIIPGVVSGGITYDVPSNIITITGYSKVSPCTFLDIYNADVAGGWGVIQQISPYFYRTVGVSFQVGNATESGWFGDIDRIIEVWDLPDMTGFITSPNNNGSIRFGRASSYNYQTASRGCVFSFYSSGMVMDQWMFDNIKEIHLYNTHIYMKTPFVAFMVKTHNANGSIWGSSFSNCFLTGNANNLFINNVKMTDGFLGLWGFTSNGGVKNIEIENCGGYCMGFSTTVSQTLSNLKISNSWNNLWMVGSSSNTLNHYLIDCDLPWHIAKRFYDSGNISVYRQYTFNLQTIPDAKITIRNNSDIVYQDYADINGTIDQQTFSMGYYNKTNSVIIVSQNPYTLEISKPGYQTYSNTFNLTEPIMWDIGLSSNKFPIPETRSITGLGFLAMCLIGCVGLIIMKRGEFL